MTYFQYIYIYRVFTRNHVSTILPLLLISFWECRCPLRGGGSGSPKGEPCGGGYLAISNGQQAVGNTQQQAIDNRQWAIGNRP